MSEKSERRKYRRVKEEINIKIDALEESIILEGFDIGKSKDMSAAGVLMGYKEPIALGQLIRITFLCPNSFELFKVEAKVVRVELHSDGLYDIGVTFMGLNEDDSKRLDYYLTYDEVE